MASPLHIAAHPDGKMYVTDNFGYVNYYDGNAYTFDAVKGVYTRNIGLVDFAIDGDGNLWGSQQGTRPGVVRYDGTLANDPIAPTELVSDAILIQPLFAGGGGTIFVGSELRPGIAIIKDQTTSVRMAARLTRHLAVLPNPAREVVQVSLTGAAAGRGVLRLFDAAGKLLRTHPVTVVADDGLFTRKLDVSRLPKGTYLLELTLGQQRSVGRLQKQ